MLRRRCSMYRPAKPAPITTASISCDGVGFIFSLHQHCGMRLPTNPHIPGMWSIDRAFHLGEYTPTVSVAFFRACLACMAGTQYPKCEIAVRLPDQLVIGN